MEEIWKDIPNHEGRYKASTLGRIKGPRKILRPHIPKNRYHSVSLSVKNGMVFKNVTCQVNRLVAMAFHGLPQNPSFHARHINHDREDNRPSNLRWGTLLENEADKDEANRRPFGEAHVNSILTVQAVKEIRLFPGIILYDVILGEHYGVAPSTIRAVREGRIWAHIS